MDVTRRAGLPARTSGVSWTAKACGPGVAVLALNRRRCSRIAPVTGARKPIPGESAQETVKTIARGRPDLSGRTCGDRRVHFLSHAGHGCRPGIRPSLRPRLFRGWTEEQSSARKRREDERVCLSDRHCERSEAIQNRGADSGLLRRFAPRNDGRNPTPPARPPPRPAAPPPPARGAATVVPPAARPVSAPRWQPPDA